MQMMLIVLGLLYCLGCLL